MLYQLLSACVILSTPLIIGVYDGIAYAVGGNDATISRLSLQTSWEYPPYQWSLCFLFGVLCGHVFVSAPGTDRVLPGWLSIGIFVVLPVAIVFATMIAGLKTPDDNDAVAINASRQYPLISVLIWLNLGAVIGAAFLHQTK